MPLVRCEVCAVAPSATPTNSTPASSTSASTVAVPPLEHDAQQQQQDSLSLGTTVARLLEALAARNARSRAVFTLRLPKAGTLLFTSLLSLVQTGIERRLALDPPTAVSSVLVNPSALRALVEAVGQLASTRDGLRLFVAEGAAAVTTLVVAITRLLQHEVATTLKIVETSTSAGSSRSESSGITSCGLGPSLLLSDLFLLVRLFLSTADGFDALCSCHFHLALQDAFRQLSRGASASVVVVVDRWRDALLGALTAFTQAAPGVLLLDDIDMLDACALWLRDSYAHSLQVGLHGPYRRYSRKGEESKRREWQPLIRLRA